MKNMKKYKWTKIVEAWTFDELIDYGKIHATHFGENGMPWSFKFKGMNITHENDQCYLIPSSSTEGVFFHWTPGQVLIWENDDLPNFWYHIQKYIFDLEFEKND